MKLIGVGLNRTGTSSLKLAFEHLYPEEKAYHFFEAVAQGKAHTDFWRNVFEKKEVDFKEFLKDYGAGFDHPFANNYKEILKAFPDAKIILSTRKFERWYNSKKTFMEYLELLKDETWGWLFRALFRLYLKIFDQISSDFNLEFIEMCDRYTHGGRRFLEIPKDEMKKLYNSWHRDILSTVPREKILTYNVRQGWKPLCKFLDIPDSEVPEIDFPHTTMWSVQTLKSSRRAARAAILFVSILTSYYFLMSLEWMFEISKYLGLRNKRNVFIHGTRKAW